MRKSGGIIALIASVIAILAAIVTLSVGGIGGAFNANNADMVIFLGFGGLFFSFVGIILGAVCMNAKKKMPSILLMLSAILGAIMGGTFVAIFMILVFVGGALAFFDKS